MIALQARNPQLPDPARATTQMANMMNMASQQRAAQLQGERIRQEMDYARAGEERAVETQRLNVRKEDQAYRVAGMTELRDRGVGVLQSGSEEAYQLWLRQADAIDPDSAAVMRQIAPTFNKDAMTFAITKADEFIANNTSKRKTEIIYDKNGIPILVESGGNTDYEATPIVATKIRDVNQPPRATPTAPPVTAGADVDMRATRGANTTPQDLINQGMNPNNIPSGMPTSPASFTGGGMAGAGAGQMTPDVMSRIVDSAFETGVMAQVDFDQLLASQAPQNKQALMNAFQQANITLQADAPSLADSGIGQQPMAANPVQRPQAGFADFRGPAPQISNADLGSQPMTRQTQAQYRVGDPIQGRNPSVSPAPAETPQQAGNRARAERITPAETAANEAAKIGAQTKANIAEENRLKAKGRKLFSSVLNDLRNDYRKLNEMEAIPSVERGGFENVGDYIGASRMGRMAQSAVGAKASVPLNTISNSKLTLMNALKEATGLSATQLSSNIELMTFLDSLADPTQGFESAMETIRRLENLYGAPAATATAAAAPRAAAKTPVIPDAARQMLRKNPSPQQRAFFDRTFGKGAAAKVLGVR